MHKRLFLCCSCFWLINILSAAVVVLQPETPLRSDNKFIDFSHFGELVLAHDNRELAQATGRRLSLREKIGISIFRSKLKRAQRKIARDKEPARDGMPLAALVCGILGFSVPFLSIAAIVLGAIGRGRNRYIDPPRFRMATWGMWLGIGTILLGFLLLLLLAALFFSWRD